MRQLDVVIELIVVGGLALIFKSAPKVSTIMCARQFAE